MTSLSSHSVVCAYDGTGNRRIRCDHNGVLDVDLGSSSQSTLDNSLIALNNIDSDLSSIDTRLDASIGDINNTTSIGDGSSQLRAVCLGYDRSNGKGRSLLVDADGDFTTGASAIGQSFIVADDGKVIVIADEDVSTK